MIYLRDINHRRRIWRAILVQVESGRRLLAMDGWDAGQTPELEEVAHILTGFNNRIEAEWQRQQGRPGHTPSQEHRA